jgi:hypothetical protein
VGPGAAFVLLTERSMKTGRRDSPHSHREGRGQRLARDASSRRPTTECFVGSGQRRERGNTHIRFVPMPSGYRRHFVCVARCCRRPGGNEKQRRARRCATRSVVRVCRTSSNEHGQGASAAKSRQFESKSKFVSVEITLGYGGKQRSEQVHESAVWKQCRATEASAAGSLALCSLPAAS